MSVCVIALRLGYHCGAFAIAPPQVSASGYREAV